MVIYFNLHDNLHIPKAFQVPDCKPWPTWSWQQKMGSQVQSIRTGTMFLSEEEKNALESMCFKWGPKGRTPQRANKRQKSK